ncbi:hypothetical protein AB0O90_08335 [Microbacterium testaceum]|uniref:hypothetical protein n=1 Tax=Microbacterium testaceum TaxID=2033 RepID=UPI0034235EA8
MDDPHVRVDPLGDQLTDLLRLADHHDAPLVITGAGAQFRHHARQPRRVEGSEAGQDVGATLSADDDRGPREVPVGVIADHRQRYDLGSCIVSDGPIGGRRVRPALLSLLVQPRRIADDLFVEVAHLDVTLGILPQRVADLARALVRVPDVESEQERARHADRPQQAQTRGDRDGVSAVEARGQATGENEEVCIRGRGHLPILKGGT